MKLLSFICSALFACALMVNATYAADAVTCPSVDKIQQAAALMTKVEYSKFDKTYTASTPTTAFIDNNKEWKLGSLFIRAHSIEEALTIGQNRAATVTQPLYQSASIRNSIYLCLYYDGTLENPYVSIMASAMR